MEAPWTLHALPGFEETFDAFISLSPAEWGLVAGVAIWCLLLSIPLTGIDRRDGIARATYAVFMAFAGAALLFGATAEVGRGFDVLHSSAATAVMAAIAAYRYGLVKRPKVVPGETG